MKAINNNKSIISKLISAQAKRLMGLYPTSEEWPIAIIILTLIKLGTMAISAYAAYSFFLSYTYPIIKQTEISRIVTAIILVLLEILTAVFLTKFFKFLFRKMYFISVLVFIVSAGLYTISFISSTNGLAQRQSSKEDNSGIIKNELLLKMQQLKSEKHTNLQEINNLIEDIRTNPIVWSKGKRVFLSKEQQNNIIELERQKTIVRNTHNIQLEKLNKQFQEELAHNQFTKLNTANKYYTVMAAIMAIQFIVTGILVFFLHLIYFQEHDCNLDYKFTHNPVPITKKHSAEVQMNTAHETPKMNINGHQINGDKEYLKKHKEIVNAILMHTHENQGFLSNTDINTKILPRLTNVKYKSVSLIRKVFAKMQVFGFINLISKK